MWETPKPPTIVSVDTKGSVITLLLTVANEALAPPDASPGYYRQFYLAVGSGLCN